MPKKPEEDQQNLNQTPNLLDPSLNRTTSSAQKAGSFLPVIAGTVLLLNIVQLAVIVWHAAQNNHLTDLKNMSVIAYKKYLPTQADWEQINKVIEKTAKYKEVTLQKQDVTKYMEIVISYLPPEIQLLELTYSANEVTMRFEAQSVLAFAKIIDNYFRNESTDGIELKSASLNTTDKTYAMEVGVTFK